LAALPFYDEIDPAAVDALLISQYVFVRFDYIFFNSKFSSNKYNGFAISC